MKRILSIAIVSAALVASWPSLSQNAPNGGGTMSPNSGTNGGAPSGSAGGAHSKWSTSGCPRRAQSRRRICRHRDGGAA